MTKAKRIKKKCDRDQCEIIITTSENRLNGGRDKFCSRKCSLNVFRKKGQEANRGKPPWNKGRKMPQISGKNNCLWKGSEVGYYALHEWIRRQLGKPRKCSKCGTKKAKRYEWANISGEYKRDVDDYIRLCKSCHHKYDKIWKKRKRNTKGQFN
ncbi:MAG TPA: hypothetical protein ENI23_10350 [bacterium]|nr:hypothetical protein [bacterium]